MGTSFNPASLVTHLCISLHAIRYTSYTSCMNKYPVIFLLCIPLITLADDSLRNTLSGEDFELIRETNLKFNTCLQETAFEKIDELPDVREVAALAVDDCKVELEHLRSEFDKSRLNPNFYHGLINNIKNRAIRQLMPLLMMEKSRR